MARVPPGLAGDRLLVRLGDSHFGPASIPPQWNAVWTTVQTVLTFVMLASVLRQLRESGPTRPQEMPAGAAGVDVPAYEYPPTFLLVPRVLAVVAPEFVAFRHVWLLSERGARRSPAWSPSRAAMDAGTGSRSLWLLPLGDRRR